MLWLLCLCLRLCFSSLLLSSASIFCLVTCLVLSCRVALCLCLHFSLCLSISLSPFAPSSLLLSLSLPCHVLFVQALKNPAPLLNLTLTLIPILALTLGNGPLGVNSGDPKSDTARVTYGNPT